jgi:hypothetical protein
MDKTLSDAILVANEAGLTDRDLAAAVEAATAAKLAAAEQPGMVPLTHPDLPDRPPYFADPDAVEVYLRSGWQRVPDEDAAPDLAVGDLPKGNASRDEWWAYALGHGLTAEDVEPLSRDEIRDHFNEETSA